MGIGADRAFSPAILVCCVVAMAGLGFALSLTRGAATDPNALGFFSRLAAAIGGRVVWRRVGGERTLWGTERARNGSGSRSRRQLSPPSGSAC